MPRLSPVERAVAAAGDTREEALRTEGDAWRVRGVVHTPAEVARYVVSRVDEMLVRDLGLAGGVADPRVALVDPACGPGAFLAAALGVAGRRKSVPGRFVGIDLDPDAVATAQRVLGPAAAARAWPLELRAADTLADVTPFGAELASDAVVVVVGNPPWAGKSANRGAETSGLLEDFRCDADGVRLAERKIGVLSDDYVRFFRWACEVVREGPGGGVLGLTTNGSFVDGPVHRGMRGALVRWFDVVDVVDLGGNALLSRTGEKDENVFGVRPSVALTLGSRAPALPNVRRARVRYAAVRGSRSQKLERLASGEVELSRVRAAGPAFIFEPAMRDERYESWPSLDEIFRFHAEGVQTNRDDAVIDSDPERLIARVEAFVGGREDASLAKARLPSGHYDPRKARERLEAALAADPSKVVQKIAYRPFDDRYFVPVTPFCHRPRPKLGAAIAHGGPILVTVRKDRGKRPWTHFGAVTAIPDNCYLSNRSSCRTRAFPAHDPSGRDNLDPEGAAAILAAIDEASADDVQAYVLAILAAEGYRTRYDGLLKVSYPRIPPPRDRACFDAVRAAGKRLFMSFVADGAATAEVGEGDPVSVGHHSVSSAALARAVTDASDLVESILADD